MTNLVKCLIKNSLIWVISFVLCECHLLKAQDNNLENQNFSVSSKSVDSPPRLISQTSNYDFDINDLRYFTDSKDVKSLSIKIVESQSFNSLHNMDQIWLAVCQNMGHTASIEQQTLLDNTDFFNSTDLLIISSGVITMPDNRRDIIQQFAEQGKPVYFQAEYDPELTSNQAYETIVNSMGGSFAWEVTVEGDLIPMNVTGVLSANPNSVPTLNYFWYGVKGSGNNTIEAFLEFQGNHFGFIFTPPNPDFGTIITVSDQDWAIQSAEKMLLMENIITYLSSTLTGIEKPKSLAFDLLQNSPNPFNGSTIITFSLDQPQHVKIIVFNTIGNLIQILADDYMLAGNHSLDFNSKNFPEGIYYYSMYFGNSLVETRKMNLLR